MTISETTSRSAQALSQRNRIMQDEDYPQWDTYRRQANTYLNRPTFQANGPSPVTGEMLTSSAAKALADTGVMIPVELPLLQGQFEGQYGRFGRAGRQTNPFNVGEFDAGTTQTFGDTQQGTDAYADLIARRYMNDGRTMDDLLNNFVDVDGNRYASNPDYERQMRRQRPIVERIIREEL